MKLESVNVKLGLPFGIGTIVGTWTPDEAEQSAAWEMYVELVTRVSVAKLAPNEGLLSESLSSLHTLFGSTRAILRKYGPAVATPDAGQVVTFGYLAVAILNGGIRPLLAKWHPILVDYEQRRPDGMSSVEWEQRWEQASELRSELEDVRVLLTSYAGILGEVCGARLLLHAVEFQAPE